MTEGIKPANLTTKGMTLIRHTDEQVMETLKKYEGNITLTAKELGIGSSGLSKRIRKSKVLSEFIQDFDDATTSEAINVIVTKIRAGDLNAAMFWLKNKGSDRGFLNEMTIKMFGNINHTNYDLTKLTEEELLNLEQLTLKLDSGDGISGESE